LAQVSSIGHQPAASPPRATPFDTMRHTPWPKLTGHHQTLTLSSLTSPTNSAKGSHPTQAAAAPTHHSTPRLRTTAVAPCPLSAQRKQPSTQQPSRRVYSGADERSCGGRRDCGSGRICDRHSRGRICNRRSSGRIYGWRRSRRRGDLGRLVYMRAREKLWPAAGRRPAFPRPQKDAAAASV
jgi:hypothetical protein